MGGAGAYSSLFLRGQPSQQTAIYFDGILLNDPLGGPVNLENIPLSLFKSIEFYSEHTPFHLAGSSLGGYIDLIPMEMEQDETSFFGEIHANTLLGGGLGIGIAPKNSLHYSSFEGSRNHYKYSDDGGTPLLNREDDSIRNRENEDFWSIGHTSFIKTSKAQGRQNFKILFDYYGKKQGLAGSAMAPLKKVDLSNHRIILKLAYQTGSLSWFSMDIHLSGHAVYSSLKDPDEELGFLLSRQERIHYNTETGINSSFYFMDSSLNLYFFLGTRFYQMYSGLNTNSLEHLANRYEINSGVGLEYYPREISLRIINSFKADFLEDAPFSGLNQNFSQFRDNTSQNYFLPSWSILIYIYPLGWLNSIFKLQPSWEKQKVVFYSQFTPIGTRAPYVYETYGDASLILPNPALKKENSKLFSIGLKMIFRIGQTEFLFKGLYFKNQFEDLILLLMNSENTFRAENIGASLNQGFELELKIIWQEYFTFLNRFNFLKAVDQGEVSFYKNKNLPFSPKYKTFHYLEAGPGWGKLFFEALWRGEIYRDRFNTEKKFLPSHFQVNVGLIYLFQKSIMIFSLSQKI